LDRDGNVQEPPRLFPVAEGSMNPLVAVLSPAGDHLYVSNWGSGDVSAYCIGENGALRPLATVTPAEPRPLNPSGMVISPDGRYLFMAAFNDRGPGRISTFAIDRTGRPWSLATIDARGDGSAAAALAPDGRALYVANMISGDVSAFAVGAGGSLRW